MKPPQFTFCALLASLPLLLVPPCATAAEVWLSSLGTAGVDQEWGQPHADKALEGGALKIGGKSFEHGLATHAASSVQIALDGQGERFEAAVGIDDEVAGKTGMVVFRAQADGREVYNSGIVRGGEAPRPVAIALAGVKTLLLLVDAAGSSNSFDHADWADAKFVMKSGEPKMVVPPPESAAILTPNPIATPRINGARVFGVHPGAPFLFTVAATGDRPMTFSADGLPAGLQLDAGTGRITGSLPRKANTRLPCTRRTPSARRRAHSRSSAADHRADAADGLEQLELFCQCVTAEQVMAAADAMVSSGLINHGWTYINIDDFWEVNKDSKDPTLQGPYRDAAGTILPNPRFPHMKQLADYVHGKGLKIGLYSSPGPWTCGKCVGSYQHEEQDARHYGEWGFDYLKYDWCSYNDVDHGDHSLPALKKPTR